jgi:hypothetical protein
LRSCSIPHGQAESSGDEKSIFRFDTFGDEQFWTETLQMQQVIKSVSPRAAAVVQIHMPSDSDGSRVGFDPVGLLMQPGQTLRWSRRGSFEQRYRGGLVGRVLPLPESGVGRARCE